MGKITAFSKSKFGTLETARVTNVYYDDKQEATFGIDIVTFSGRIYKNVTYLCPFVKGASGIYQVPEKDSMCLVGYINDEVPIVLGFFTPRNRETHDYRYDREALMEGDICLKTKQYGTTLEAKIVIYKSGKIYLESTPACNIHLDPITHTILTNALNLIIVTSGGLLRWEKNADNDTTDFSMDIYSKKAKKGDFTKISIGNKGNVVKININDKCNLHIDPEGNISLNTKGNINVNADGDIKMTGRTIQLNP